MRRTAFVIVAALAALVAPDALAKFGITKTHVMLPRLRPPETRILAEDLALDVRSGSPEATGSHVALVRGRLEQAVRASELFQLTERAKDAGAVVHVTLDALSAEVRDEVAMESRRVKVGEKQVWNEKKKKYETEDVYANRNEPVSYRVANGSVSATVEIEDLEDRQTRDASASYSQRFRTESGVPGEASSEESLRRHLVTAAAENVVGIVAYAQDPVEALLAVDGELKAGNQLAEQGRFEQALAEWERKTYKGDKEAARLHNVGVAHEALAYAFPPHAAEQLQHLQQARDHYRAARELDPGEKYFKDPLERIEASLSYAARAASQVAERRRLQQERAARRAAPPPPARPAAAQSAAAKGSTAPKASPAEKAAALSGSASAQTPLRNGSFEAALKPWTLTGTGNVVSEPGRGRVLELKAGEAGVQVQQPIGVDVGASATLGLEYKVTGGESRIQLLLGYVDATGKPRTSTLEVTAGEGPGAWSPWSVDLAALRPRAARATEVTIVVAGGAVRLDNVALTPR